MVDKALVRRLRRRLNLTQAELGQAIGQDQPYISNVERGIRPVLAVATLDKLASALGVRMEELLTAAYRNRRRDARSREEDLGPSSGAGPGKPSGADINAPAGQTGA